MLQYKLLFCASLHLILSACTNQEIYESNQHSQRLECQKLPPSQVQECLDRVNLSYEEYDELREEALKKD